MEQFDINEFNEKLTEIDNNIREINCIILSL